MKNESQAEQEVPVYTSIKQMILADKIKYGERFLEAQVADMLNVSRMPVREAIQKLMYEGFVERAEKTGYRIKQFTEQDIIDTYVFRECLDGMLTRVFTHKSAPSQLYYLESILDSMSKAKETDDEPLMSHIDFEFHRVIARGANNPQMFSQFAILLEKISYIAKILFDPGPEGEHRYYTREMSEDTYAEHALIFTKIQNNDPDGAENASRESARSGLRKILNALAAKNMTFSRQ